MGLFDETNSQQPFHLFINGDIFLRSKRLSFLVYWLVCMIHTLAVFNDDIIYLGISSWLHANISQCSTSSCLRASQFVGGAQVMMRSTASGWYGYNATSSKGSLTYASY